MNILNQTELKVPPVQLNEQILAKMLCHKLIILTFFVYFKSSSCQDNNVCPTIRDYITMKNNNNCWYNFAADIKVVSDANQSILGHLHQLTGFLTSAFTQPEIIRRSGYPFMEYRVQTKDGYILNVFRIPSVRQDKGPVFMMHGVQSTSGIFVSLGPNSLGNAPLNYCLYQQL